MKKNITSLVLLTLLCHTSMAQNTTVQQDPDFRIGKLKNGLTYYIRHNAKEKGIADFYIAQQVGSILEEPRQRGLAHFLEHMAFNGTKHFKGTKTSPGIVSWCESIGVKFGTNLNAYTSVDQTVYRVSAVPIKRESVIDSTLLILHDWSHELLLQGDEIDKERGVIREEWRTRRAGMATQRMIENVLPIVYKGTKYEDCLPIGNLDIINNFAYNDLRDYYHKWYRPDLQAIIVIGDIDVDQMEEKIIKLFSRIPKAKNPAKRVYYPVNDNTNMIVAIDKDAEQPIVIATLYTKRDATPDSEKNTLDYQRKGYYDLLVTQMLNSRLQELQNQAQPPVLSASAKNGQFIISRTKDAFSLSIGCRQENIQGSIQAVIRVIEQARQHGFTPQEMQQAMAKVRKTMEQRFAERNNKRNNQYANDAIKNFLQNEPITTAEADLQMVKAFEDGVSTRVLHEALLQMATNTNQVLVVYAPEKPDFTLPNADTFKQWVTEAQNQKYEAYKETALPATLMPQLPKPGTIVAEKKDIFGSTKLTLSNGVEVYIKPTQFANNSISMHFWSNGGKSLFTNPNDLPSLGFVASTIAEGGVANIPVFTLKKMLASKVVSVKPSLEDDTHSLSGSSSVKDLETLLQLTHLYCTAPRKDSVVFAGSIDRTRSFLTNRDANPQVAYNDSLNHYLYGDHPRTSPMTREKLDQVSLTRIMEMYNTCFGDVSGFKMTLLGNVNIDSIKPLLCTYIASLPAKRHPLEANTASLPNIREVNETHLFNKKMNTPSALVTVVYTFKQPSTAKADLHLDIFRRVLSIAYTDSVREEKGGTYGVSTSAQLEISDKDEPNTYLKISFRTDPKMYETLIPIIYRQIEHIAHNGPLAASMEKVKKYLTKQYAQNAVTNGYWDYVLYNYLQNGVDFDNRYVQMVKETTARDIQKVAQEMLRANNRIEVTMMPE